MPSAALEQPLATYEDLGYRDVFWRTRRYEDGCDRIALRALLPRDGGSLIEVGAGFGRLADEYAAFERVTLLDASDIHVQAARETLAGDPRIEVVSGDALHLPFADATFDVAVCVRVLHHFADASPLIEELARVVRPGGAVILEFANKRNLKSIARYAARRQRWSPFRRGSVSYKPFHFDHAPADIHRALRRQGLRVERIRAVSLFRVPAITRRLPVAALLRTERALQAPLGTLTPSPSVFIQARKAIETPSDARGRAEHRSVVAPPSDARGAAPRDTGATSG